MGCPVVSQTDLLHRGMLSQTWRIIPRRFHWTVQGRGGQAPGSEHLRTGKCFRSVSLGTAQRHVLGAPFGVLASLWSSQTSSAASAVHPRPAHWGPATSTSSAQLSLNALHRALSSSANATFRTAADSEAPSPASTATTELTQDKPPPKKRGRKKKAAKEADTETQLPALGSNDASALPSVNLAAAIPQGGEWDNVKRWVVFSDLHVSHKTVDIACQVLRRVRKEAEARDAGVLFLGKIHYTPACSPPSCATHRTPHLHTPYFGQHAGIIDKLLHPT